VDATQQKPGPAYLWLRYACGHYEQAKNGNALEFFLRMARTLQCSKCEREAAK
jgi:hypothetical protein